MAGGALLVAAWTVRTESKARRRLEDRLEEERRQETERLARSVAFSNSVFIQSTTHDGAPRLCVVARFEVDNEGDRSIHDVLVSAEIRFEGQRPFMLRDESCAKLPAGARYGTEQPPTSTYLRAEPFGVLLPENHPGVLGDTAGHLVYVKVSFTDGDGPTMGCTRPRLA